MVLSSFKAVYKVKDSFNKYKVKRIKIASPKIFIISSYIRK
ncbi:unknown [Ruminococcus sp. CAG:353]|nr:unknown [Ruminococcus sp. CAG:353]